MGRRMQLAAVLGLGVALGAFAAIPALHLINHEDDHIHVGGAIVQLHDQDAPSDEEGPSDETPSQDHGGQSLAHFGAALIESSPPPAVFVSEHEAREVIPPDRAPIASDIRSPKQARAPPQR